MESGQSWAWLSSAVVPVASNSWALGMVDSDHRTESSHDCCSSKQCRNAGQAVWGPGVGTLLCVLHYHQLHLHSLQLCNEPLLLEPQGDAINKTQQLLIQATRRLGAGRLTTQPKGSGSLPLPQNAHSPSTTPLVCWSCLPEGLATPSQPPSLTVGVLAPCSSTAIMSSSCNVHKSNSHMHAMPSSTLTLV